MKDFIHAEIDTDAIRNLLKDLKGMEEKAPLVLSRAINRAAQSARTNLSKDVSKQYKIGSREAGKDIVLKNKASRGKLSAEIVSVSFSRPLMKYDVSPKRPVRFVGRKGKKRPNIAQYFASVKRDSSRKSLGHAFVAIMDNGPGKKEHVGVFVRVPKGEIKQGNKRNKIRELKSVNVPIMVSNDKVIEQMHDKLEEVLTKRVHHEIGRILKGN